MSALTQYLLETAHLERQLYQAQVQQNWLGPVQAVLLLAITPVLIRHIHDYAPDGLMALNRSRDAVDFAAAFALLYPYIALILFTLQLLPSLLRKPEKDLGKIGASILKGRTEKTWMLRQSSRSVPLRSAGTHFRDNSFENADRGG